LKQAVVNLLPFPKVRLDPRFRVGLTLGVVEIPEAGNPAPAKQVIQLLDFFG